MKVEMRKTAEYLTSYSGLFPIMKYVKENLGKEISENLVMKTQSTNKIKEHHIYTLLSMEYIGCEKLERVELLKNDPVMKTLLKIKVTDPENISRFLKKFTFKETIMLSEINLSNARKALKMSNIKHITIDIDSSVKSVEGFQEGTSKGYNPENIGNHCYNILYAFAEELKLFIAGNLRSGDTNTSNGASELVKTIVAGIGDVIIEITFRADCGYLSEKTLETIEASNHKYVIRSKEYKTLAAKLREHKENLLWHTYKNGKEVAEINLKLDSWEKTRRFIVSREKREDKQFCLDDFDSYDYAFFVTNHETWTPVDVLWFYEKRGNMENHIKETKYDFSVNTITLDSFWANEALFQIQMIAYNMLILFKLSNEIIVHELRETAKTFRLKYIFVSGKLIFGSRKLVLNISCVHPYRETIIKLAG